MSIKDIMLSERSQSQKIANCEIQFMWKSCHEVKQISGCQDAAKKRWHEGVWGGWGVVMEPFCILIVVVVTQAYTCVKI